MRTNRSSFFTLENNIRFPPNAYFSVVLLFFVTLHKNLNIVCPPSSFFFLFPFPLYSSSLPLSSLSIFLLLLLLILSSLSVSLLSIFFLLLFILLFSRFRADSLTNKFWVESLSGCQLDNIPLKSLKCIRCDYIPS